MEFLCFATTKKFVLYLLPLLSFLFFVSYLAYLMISEKKRAGLVAQRREKPLDEVLKRWRGIRKIRRQRERQERRSKRKH